MTIQLNDETIKLPSDDMTVAELLDWRNQGKGGTAVAVNDRLIRKADWSSRHLAEGDRVTVISAAFGG